MVQFKRIINGFLLSVFAVGSLAFLAPITPVGAAACEKGLLTFPAWHRGLTDGQCRIVIDQLNDLWRIALNVVEILLQVAGYAAVGYLMWGGFRFIKSQGQPNEITTARTAMLNASIGLIIALTSVAIVRFIGERF